MAGRAAVFKAKDCNCNLRPGRMAPPINSPFLFAAVKDYVHECFPEIADKIMLDAHLIFWGMRAAKQLYRNPKQVV